MSSASFPAQDELGIIFADVLIEIISKISGFSLESLVISSEPDCGFDGIIGLMNLAGKAGKGATVFISAREADMRVLCSLMTGTPKEEVTKEDVRDALCELVNMTAGNVKLRLGGAFTESFTLSTPFVIDGENMSLSVKKRVRFISKCLGNGEFSLKLKVIYETPDRASDSDV